MDLPKVIICDIDGTLALMGDRDRHDPSSGEDTLNNPIANILEVYTHQTIFPVEIILMTGRNEKYRELTENWLKKHNITNYKQLFMRGNGDFRKDYTLKKELYKKHIQGKYDVLFVLEDRDQVVQMWRSIGLTCLQVEYGDF